MLKKILKIFFNKYTITLLLFGVWMMFFDNSSLLNRMKFKEKLNTLKQEKRAYLNEIKNDSILTEKLLSDTLEMEKFARENYLMKKDKEDVFLLIDTTVDRHP
ncbi:MAG: septum formation inhibitor [Bacteroidales bacterium]